MITKAIALTLKHRQILHHTTQKNADGTPLRVRVNGVVQTWKTRPDHFRIPVKYGFKTCMYVEKSMDRDNSAEWEVAP